MYLLGICGNRDVDWIQIAIAIAVDVVSNNLIRHKGDVIGFIFDQHNLSQILCIIFISMIDVHTSILVDRWLKLITSGKHTIIMRTRLIRRS